MATVTTPLLEKAETIFTELGYSVSDEGTELRAQRRWRVVHVTPLDGPGEPPQSGDLRCFVTWMDSVDAVAEQVAKENPDYEWALIAVDEDGEYEVHHAPGPRLPA